MSGTMHTLIKEIDTEYAEHQPDGDVQYQYRIECADPAKCDGWIQCSERHEVDGRSADGFDEGPFECEPDAPWFDLEEFEFHGAVHTWKYGHDWTVPYEGCLLEQGDWEPPEEVEQGPVGRYPVIDEWDDTECTLSVYSEAAAPQHGSAAEVQR